MHYIEVDQSGKIEDTKIDTVLAFSNGVSNSLLIPVNIKREVANHLRDRGKTGSTFYPLLFATALYLLLQEHTKDLSVITIDKEYTGQEPVIKSHLLNLLNREDRHIPADRIRFDFIGKSSPAHKLVIETLRGKRKPGRVVTLAELLEAL